MGLLDLLFPKTCVGCGKLGEYLCERCVGQIEYLEVQLCSRCYKNAIGGKTHPKCETKFGLDGVVSFCNYKGTIREVIKNLKYRFTTALLGEVSKKIVFDPDLLPNKSWVALPVPLHKSRENFRGFNQAELLGKIMAQKLNLSFDSSVLKRKSETKSQVGLSQKQRKDNIALAFEVRGEVRGKGFYIFDDVWTSGATLNSVAKELKRAGAEYVWGLTLAHPR